jgi:type IV pilus assembly protein PilV
MFMMSPSSQARRQRGVSLIEVLVAVLVFSLGLIGLASLLVVANQSNQSAYLRTQAGFLASSMADRMRANPIGVWDADYDATDYPQSAGTLPNCSGATGCSPADVAKRDRLMWSLALRSFLPHAKATIACDKSGLGYTPSAEQVLQRPPYGGSCTMRITWNERGVVAEGTNTSQRKATPQTFDWVFSP